MADMVQAEVILVTEETIKDKIYTFRGQKVMLDFDLAELYGYETRYLNQQVGRNSEKFEGDDFMFQLTDEEFHDLMLQNVTSRWGGTRKPPFAFTEQGIYMLMTVLKGELAVKQSRALVRLFKQMKDYINDAPQMIAQEDITRLSLQTAENTQEIRQIKEDMATKDDLEKFMKNFADNHIGREYLVLDGKTVESDMAYAKIYSLAKKSIYVVDDYIGLKTLYLLKDVPKTVDIIIFSDNRSNHLTNLEFVDFCTEYPDLNISFKKTEGKYHDRFIFLDYKARTFKVYHCGASSKDGGKRVMAISKMDDKNLYKPMIDDLLGNPDLVLR